MPDAPRTVTINLDSADPRPALNAFLWAMSAARRIGYTPKTEHQIIEHFVREEVGVLYYSNASSIVSILESKGADPDDFDDTMEVIEVLSRRKKRQRQRTLAEQFVGPPAPPTDTSR